MIDLEKKCVLVRTHEEYENVLKVAKEQGYRWYGVKEAYPYPFEEQRIPDILKFYSNKELARNASLESGYELVEISEIFEDEEKIKDAVKLVRTFTKYPDRTALTDSFIKSLKLLADTVESQMEMLKGRIREYGMDDLLKAMDNIRHSDFLRGENKNGWMITFDWFVKPNNFLKVLEGNYNGDRKHGSGAKTQRKVEPLIPFGTLSDDGDSDTLPFM